MPEYGVFTKPDAEKVAEATRRVLATPGTRRILGLDQQVSALSGRIDKFDAITTSAITAASDAKTGSTTFTFTFLLPDGDNPGDLKDGTTGTGVNRSLDVSAGSGTYVIVAWIAGEWRPIWVDC